MGLMVLLFLTLSALIQVESSAASQQRNLALARQNALAGAYQAVGVLQQQLGPDRRVTARADLDSSNTVNPYWVGVWSTESVSSLSAAAFNSSRSQLGVTPVRWLVSMSTASSNTSSLSPAKSIDQSVSVTLVNSPGEITGSLAQPVTAARIAIKSGDQISGGYAWWVADEGMKASLRLNNQEKTDESASLNGLSQQQRRARRTLSPVRAGVETLATNGSGTLRGDSAVLPTAEQSKLSRMVSSGQLAYLSTLSFTQTRASALSHDMTALSMGVLASTLETTGGNTLKIDLSSVTSSGSSQMQSLFGDSAAGIWSYLNAYREATLSNGIPAFPLKPTVPDDQGNVVEGKAYFAIAPMLSELYFSSSFLRNTKLYANNNNSANGITHWPANPAVRGGYFGIDTRSFAYFELWNPYSTAILPVGGHLSLRIRSLPDFRLRYWYDASAITNIDAPNSTPIWVENTISGGVSGWLNLMDKLKSANGSKDYIGVHLLNQASTSAVPLLYHAGTVLYWFGMRRDQSNADVGHQTGRGEEYLAGYGAAKEIFKESNRGLTHAYYQSYGAHIAAAFSTSVDVDNVRMPAYPEEALTADSPYRDDTYANRVFNFFTAAAMEWKSAQPTVELWWVPDSGDKFGNISAAVLLSSVKMPANAASSAKPISGEMRNDKFDPINHNNEHYALHYVRKDASDSQKADGRINSAWLTSTTSMDPRNPGVMEDAFKFFDDKDDPNDHFTQEDDKGRVTTSPDLSDTLKQQLDRKSGVLANGSELTYQQVHAYIYGNSSPKLTYEGDPNPARKSSLFEVPTSVPISLGVLQNVALGKRRPFCIGNAWGRDAGISGENVNRVFDRAYLSGVTVSALSALDPTIPMPNSNLLPLWSSTSSAPVGVSPEDVLSYFLVKGAFNVNSTSTEAWKAFLGGGWIEDWDYVSIPDSPTDDRDRSEKQLPLRRSFLRFSHTGDETFTAPDNSADMPGDINGKYYRRGVRRLTNAQLEAMATIIVDGIKSRNGPYASIAEFLSAPVGGVSGNPSLLEYAANPSDAYAQGVYSKKGAELPYMWTAAEMSEDGSASGTTPGAIDVGSPADLTQGAMLNTLAPLIQARSDTFKIRAYGDVKDGNGQIAATALCEMTVQRMPDPVEDSSNTANRKKPGSKGRTFKVISIQWIQES